MTLILSTFEGSAGFYQMTQYRAIVKYKFDFCRAAPLTPSADVVLSFSGNTFLLLQTVSPCHSETSHVVWMEAKVKY